MYRLVISIFCFLNLAWATGPITVKVDGKVIDFPHEQPKAFAGRTLVPIRGIFEAIGAYVEWNPTTRMVTCKKGNEDLELRVGDRIAKKNGIEIEIDAAPRIVHGTTMVPLRFIAEGLGAKVDFDQANNIVEITTENSNIDFRTTNRTSSDVASSRRSAILRPQPRLRSWGHS